MDISLTQIIATIVMLGLGFALVIGYRAYLARNSERRMRSMIDSLGLDSDNVSIAKYGPVMGEVRQRCRHCTAEDVCERWLRGEEEGDNAFCPNARVFNTLIELRDLNG